MLDMVELHRQTEATASHAIPSHQLVIKQSITLLPRLVYDLAIGVSSSSLKSLLSETFDSHAYFFPVSLFWGLVFFPPLSLFFGAAFSVQIPFFSGCLCLDLDWVSTLILLGLLLVIVFFFFFSFFTPSYFAPLSLALSSSSSLILSRA